MDPILYIIIPCYNEEEVLPITCEMFLEKLTFLIGKGKISDEEVKLAIKRAGLDPDDKRTYKKYSLGMKQKLGIANAIMGEPDIIVLDEPINALDEISVENVKNVFLELKEKGKLIIAACHDREELEYLCDIIYELKDGEIAGMEMMD